MTPLYRRTLSTSPAITAPFCRRCRRMTEIASHTVRTLGHLVAALTDLQSRGAEMQREPIGIANIDHAAGWTVMLEKNERGLLEVRFSRPQRG